MLLTELFQRLLAMLHLSQHSAMLYRLGAEFAAWGAFLSLAWRALPQVRRDTIERSWPRLIGIVRVLIAWGVDLRSAVAAAGYQIVSGRAKADVVADRASRVPPVSTMAILAISALALAGCPRLPPVDLCPPGSQSCIGDRPHVCSQSQRWAPATPRTCASAGLTCCYTRSPYGRDLYACVPAAACIPEGPVVDDAGAPEGGAR
jgi:hypothetical protein